MAKAKLTLFGMYEYGKESGEYDIFDSITLPDGMDKDLLINNILIRGGEFEVLYAQPLFFKFCVDVWIAKWTPTIERWWRALNLEYDPLENYDRKEDWRDDTSTNKDITTKRNDMTTASDKSTQTTTGNVENTVSAFDQTTYQPAENAATSGSASNDSQTVSATGSLSSDKESGMQLSGHTGRIHGNIGVTTSQQMLQSELDIARFNIYEEITDLFLKELTIYTY